METTFDGCVLVSNYLDHISKFVDDGASDLWPINKRIHDNPELGYEEHIAHDTLTSFMESIPD